MKLKCNVCLESPTVELSKPEEDKLICCPNCGKQLAYGLTDYKNRPYWVVIDNKYDKDWGGVPVEIIEP